MNYFDSPVVGGAASRESHGAQPTVAPAFRCGSVQATPPQNGGCSVHAPSKLRHLSRHRSLKVVCPDASSLRTLNESHAQLTHANLPDTNTYCMNAGKAVELRRWSAVFLKSPLQTESGCSRQRCRLRVDVVNAARICQGCPVAPHNRRGASRGHRAYGCCRPKETTRDGNGHNDRQAHGRGPIPPCRGHLAKQRHSAPAPTAKRRRLATSRRTATRRARSELFTLKPRLQEHALLPRPDSAHSSVPQHSRTPRAARHATQRRTPPVAIAKDAVRAPIDSAQTTRRCIRSRGMRASRLRDVHRRMRTARPYPGACALRRSRPAICEHISWPCVGERPHPA